MSMATTGLVIAGAGPAAADSYQETRGNLGGSVWFFSYGEHLQIYDELADGHSVVVFDQRQDLCCTWYSGWNHGGEGSVKDYDLNMPEGDWINYYVCLGEYATKTIVPGTCSPIAEDLA
jgi:hypothetical protein